MTELACCRAGPAAALCLSAEGLAELSHGLRAPLTTVLGYAEVLTDAEPPLDAATASTVHAIHRNAIRQSRLLDNLATLADLRMGAVPRVREPVEVPALLAYMPGDLAVELADSGVRLELPAVPGRPAVTGDGRRLRQAISELVRNAVDASPRGGTVTLAATADSVLVTIHVADAGCGIPAEEQPRVLQPFVRTRRARQRHAPGVGLGLTVADGVVSAHGGVLELTSTCGHGTSVRVRLPLR